MASPITFGGLASGLDTKSIIAALVSVEGRKVSLLEFQRGGFQSRISAYDTLLGKLKKLQELSETLSDRDSFVAHSATLSDGADGVLKVTTGGSTAAGTYEVAVASLAQSTYLRSGGFVDANASLGLSGNLTLQVGTTLTNVVIDGTNDSLNEIRDAINDTVEGVNATVVFDGTDYHLELRGAETGAANAVSVIVAPGGVLSGTQIRAASDAAFTIDGQAFTSATNTVDDAIQGVTLQLLDEQAVGAAPIQLTIAEDFEGIQKQLQAFVDAYNDVVGYLGDQAKARTSDESAVKPLSGDSSLRAMRNAFSSIVSGMADITSEYKSLASLGIKSQSDGKLKIDSTKLGEALAEDVDGMVELFTHATEGIGGNLVEALKMRTDTIDGVIELRKDSYERQTKEIDKRILRAKDALAQYEQAMVMKFARYEQLIGNLKAQGSSLGALPSTSSSF